MEIPDSPDSPTPTMTVTGHLQQDPQDGDGPVDDYPVKVEIDSDELAARPLSYSQFPAERDYVHYKEEARVPEAQPCQFYNVHENTMKWLSKDLYQVGTFIDTVTYASVYEGVNLTTGEAVAVKFSNGTDESNHDLENEKRVLKNIVDSGFPTCIWFGSRGHKKILVTEKFGPSLSKLLVACKGSFTLKTTLMLADQCVARLQMLHQYGFVHCNINPDNIVMGVGELRCNQVFLVNFGLAKDWRTERNSSDGFELGPHEDLERLGCTILHVIKGQLARQSRLPVGVGLEEFAEVVNLMKLEVLGDLLQYLPEWFIEYMRYLSDLKRVKEFPDYSHIRRIFQDEMNRNCFIYDCQFDWILHKYVDQQANESFDGNPNEGGDGVHRYYNYMDLAPPGNFQ